MQDCLRDPLTEEGFVRRSDWSFQPPAASAAPMNILMFNYEYPPLGGGGGVAHAGIAEELARRHRVRVVTSAFKGLPRRESINGVEVWRVPVAGRRSTSVASLASLISYPAAAWASGISVLRGERWDVINSHFAVPTGVASVPIARFARLPHIISLHGGDIFDPSKRLSPHRLPGVRRVVAGVLRASDAVVAQSTNTRENTRRYYGFRGLVEIIPLGIRVPEMVPASRSELGLPERAFVAITVGRLVLRKQVHRLLELLTHPGLSDLHLVVVGSGPEEVALRRLAADLGLEGRVHFVGFVDETRKWQLLRSADAYVSASMHEGFGLVYLEAMAAGLPVVTPDHGGQADFLRNGDTGFLVPVGDDGALSTALNELGKNPAQVVSMGRTNQRKASRYDVEQCATAYERLFERVKRARASEMRGANLARSDEVSG